MNTTFSQTKNQTKGWMSSLRRFLIVGLVSFSLWGATLVAPAHAATADDYTTNERGSIQSTELYDQIQPEAGGMNGFDDADPRRNTRRAEAKAKTLVDSATRRNIENADSDPLEPVREAVDNLKGNVSETADSLTEKAGNQLDRVGNKLDRATDQAGSQLNRAGNQLDRATDRAGNKLDRATDRAGNKLDRATDRAGRQVNAAADRAGNRAERTLNDVGK